MTTNVLSEIDHHAPAAVKWVGLKSSQSLSLVLALAIAFVFVPLVADDYWYSAILIPWLVLGLTGLGLNLLTGYAGQLSLGSAAFMAAGAFAAYNFQLRLPGLPLIVGIGLGGVVAAALGIFFGLPSLRLKGFYLLVSTLAAQFFIQWALTKFSWFSNDNPSGVISAPPLVVLGHDFGSPQGRYLLTLGVVVPLTWIAYNLVNGPVGRSWMAIRDRETAARVMGIRVLRGKLSAFAISSFYCGVAGSLWAFTYLGTVEPHGLDLSRSFQILFIIIIGGLGSIWGSYLGAVFIVLLPTLLNQLTSSFLSGIIEPSNTENLQKIMFGSLILFFLIKEPEGLARLCQLARDKLRARVRSS